MYVEGNSCGASRVPCVHLRTCIVIDCTSCCMGAYRRKHRYIGVQACFKRVIACVHILEGKLQTRHTYIHTMPPRYFQVIRFCLLRIAIRIREDSVSICGLNVGCRKSSALLINMKDSSSLPDRTHVVTDSESLSVVCALPDLCQCRNQ
jgi:hypothetical protein